MWLPAGVLLAGIAMLTGGSLAQSRVKSDAAAEESNGQPPAVSPAATPEERARMAWKMLADAASDAKHPQTRIQALAALGMLRAPQSEKTIVTAMADADVDVRTASALAAGQTKDHSLAANLRALLTDKEPQVVFAAAMTLWKMNERAGEDILIGVANGSRSTVPTLLNGATHTISKDLHDPSALVRAGAMQEASAMLGPFGFGVSAYEAMHKNGSDPSRVAAIEQIAEDKSEPMHKELLALLGDKDPAVRAALAKALADYHDKATSTAIYGLFADKSVPVRLTAAAAYLRTTGTPGPAVVSGAAPAKSAAHASH
jgi:HEAT repeat protein